MSIDAKQTLTPKRRFPEFRARPAWTGRTIRAVCDLKAGEFVTAADIAEQSQEGLFACYGGNGLRGYVKSFTHDGRFVVIGRQGALCGNVNLLTGKFHATEHALVATPQSGIDTHWLLYALDLLKLNRFSIGQAQPGLSVGVLSGVPIFVPPEEDEQKKIAECLTSLDEVIAAQGRKVEALKAHKKGLMQRLFPRGPQGETIPRLRFPEFRDAGEWSVERLGDLLSGKPEYGVNAAAVPFSDDLPAYLRITDIDDQGRYISEGKVSVDIDAAEANYLRDGDIAVARTGASVGKSYLYRPEDGRLVFAGFLIRIRPDRTKIVPTLLANFMTTQEYWDWVRMTSARSGQPGINGTEYASLSVPIPPPSAGKEALAEQQRIADCLSSLDTQIGAESEKLDALKTHKKGLMQQLFPSTEASV